jgi:glyoxylase I family protein
VSDLFYGGVDHLAIAARDPAALADWYCEALGFHVLSDNGQPRPTRILAGPGGGMIEMMPDNASPPPSRELFDLGISHLAIRVSNLDSAMARLVAQGVAVADPVPAAGGGRVVSFRDPEGNVVQVVERPAGWGT